jgi:RNA polymerase-binding transcription factor DksA
MTSVTSADGESVREKQIMNEKLSPGILAELKERLGEQHKRLETEISTLRRAEGVGGKQTDDPSTEIKGDQGDASVEIEAWAIAHQQELNLRDQLGEVEHALSKFALGTYGRCEQCSQPIQLARLRAFPEARYDVVHQAEVEARVRGMQ